MEAKSTYQQQVEWLFSRFPSYQNIGAPAYKPGLERVEHLLELLKINPSKLAAIHVAGTNGKGSTAAYCASLLREKGLKVGLFTSPHIFDFSERIRCNGEPIKPDFVVAFCKEFQALQTSIDASFFELTFAMALRYFLQENCNFVVIETGLGGRLDATNIIQPIVSVITNIALDHQEFLGTTLPEIAAEKAGIIKAKTPVIIGEANPETQIVFENVAAQHSAPILFAKELEQKLDPEQIPLKGYQLTNFTCALLALEQCGLPCSTEQQLAALSNLHKHTGFFGRLQLWQEKPRIIVDVSHNPAGIAATLPLIEAQCKGQLYILYGAAKDKNVQEILRLFPKNAKIAACQFKNLRSKSSENWQEYGLSDIYTDVNTAIETIQKQMQTNDLLWITGSFFLISDLKSQPKLF
ncbi:MAG: bifunctional folylpolyglutamate synthase/dihydrofolate synthase [Flavobacteriales bacterium]